MSKRFTPKFINGKWNVWDNHAYRSVATRELQTQAQREADKRNASKPTARPGSARRI